MKVLFLYPSTDSQVGFNYGVAHMAALLKWAGHEVGFWQLCDELEPLPTEEQFVQRLDARTPGYPRLFRCDESVGIHRNARPLGETEAHRAPS